MRGDLAAREARAIDDADQVGTRARTRGYWLCGLWPSRLGGGRARESSVLWERRGSVDGEAEEVADCARAGEAAVSAVQAQVGRERIAKRSKLPDAPQLPRLC